MTLEHKKELRAQLKQGAAAALLRAAEQARKVAKQTGTCIVVMREGKLVREKPVLRDGND
jgi:hypothetical protein